MRQYLEGSFPFPGQRFVADFFDADKPVAAICHGVVLAARSISPRTGKSVLSRPKTTTALTWTLEKSRMVQHEILWASLESRLLSHVHGIEGTPGTGRATAASRPKSAVRWLRPRISAMFQKMPPIISRKTSGLFRDSSLDDRPAWVVRDGRYVSARWPGDAHSFAAAFAAVLAESGCAHSATG